MEREVFITLGNFQWTYNYESLLVMRRVKVSKFTASTCRIFHMTRMDMESFAMTGNKIFKPHSKITFSLQIQYV